MTLKLVFLAAFIALCFSLSVAREMPKDVTVPSEPSHGPPSQPGYGRWPSQPRHGLPGHGQMPSKPVHGRSPSQPGHGQVPSQPGHVHLPVLPGHGRPSPPPLDDTTEMSKEKMKVPPCYVSPPPPMM
ncbi:extensin-like [Capsella rubella]|uniref:extensin-like n=1 Tax=Capsella rubella TaxID=81985 RepID=UPI000CD49CFC|nr:extensin-like [Capsella rubella]